MYIKISDFLALFINYYRNFAHYTNFDSKYGGLYFEELQTFLAHLFN